MINASGTSGVPVAPAQPVAVPPVTTPPVTSPITPPAAMPGIPTTPQPAITPTPTPSPISPMATPATTPATPATTPATPANAVAGNAGGNKLKPAGKKLPIKLIIGGIVLLLLVIGGIAAYLLSQTSQDVRQQASEPTYNDTCIAKFGGSPQLMAQEVTACENQSGKNWDAVKCECVNAPVTTPPGTKICGPTDPKWDASKRQCSRGVKQ